MKYPFIIIALVGIILSFMVESSGVFHFVEMKALDIRYKLRSDLLREEERSEQIVIIGIDDDSISEIKEPFILWDTFFAEIIEMLGKYQAKIIGLDLIWTKQIDDFVTRPAKQRNALRRSLLIAKNKYHSDIVMAIGATARKTEHFDTLETDSYLPMKQFGAIVGRDAFGVVNTISDADNYIRRVKLFYQSDNMDKQALPGFSNIIASSYLAAKQNINTSQTPLLINYQLNKHFDVLPFNEVLHEARVNNSTYFNEHFANKVVLLGMTNVSGDIVPSPVSQETPGIVIHAYAIDMLINNNLLHKIETHYIVIIMVLLAFLVVYFASKNSIKKALIITLSVLLLYSVFNLAIFNFNIFMPFVSPLLLILWGFSVSYLYRFVTEERSSHRLAKFFRSYVNEQVVKEILSSNKPLALEGKREKICILFADIRNFTSYSEKLPPEEVVKVLNEYFSAMTQVILDNNGTVDKFIGDGLMAFFGAPLYIENPTLAAVKSAIQMRQQIKKLNEKWQLEGRVQLDNGIGLHTGYALVGNIGSDKKMDYTAIGDSVNTAFRVEGVTKILNAPILITRAAWEEVKSSVVCEEKGEVALKGRAGIFVYEVKGLKKAIIAK